MTDTLAAQARPARMAFHRQEQALMERLAREGQSPYALFIGCSDSRAVPEVIAGAKPGDIFVTRNIANTVPPAHAGCAAVGAVLEYAVFHLHVPHIIICGHLDCGGIKALDSRLDAGREVHIARWLGYIRPALAEVASLGLSGEARHRAIVETNVRLQLRNLLTYSCVAEAVAAGLALHGWVYDIGSGNLWTYDEATGQFVGEAE